MARALVDLEAEATDVLLRSARCVQMEPVWGGRVDAAAELRGLSALGLAGSRRREAGEVLADLLSDSEPAARSGAARALGVSGIPGAALLLRLQIRHGDEDPGILVDALSGLLALEPASGLELAAEGLRSDDELRFEASAVALGTHRRPAALHLLTEALTGSTSPDRRRALLRSMALLRTEEAEAYLVGIVVGGSEAEAVEALRVVGDLGLDPRLRERMEAAVEVRGDSGVRRAFLGYCSG